jgi:polyphosphate kinase
MSRNLDRRVEAVTPVEDPQLRLKLERLMELYLKDNRGAWDMQSDGSFVQRRPNNGEEERNSQLQLIQQWSQGIKPC